MCMEELVLPFYHMDPGDGSQVIKLGVKCLNTLYHLSSPESPNLKFWEKRKKAWDLESEIAGWFMESCPRCRSGAMIVKDPAEEEQEGRQIKTTVARRGDPGWRAWLRRPRWQSEEKVLYKALAALKLRRVWDWNLYALPLLDYLSVFMYVSYVDRHTHIERLEVNFRCQSWPSILFEVESLCCLMLDLVHQASWPLSAQRFSCLLSTGITNECHSSFLNGFHSHLNGNQTQAMRFAKLVTLPVGPSLKYHC